MAEVMVRFFEDRHFAPFGVLAQITDQALHDKAMSVVVANGGRRTESVLLGWDDIYDSRTGEYFPYFNKELLADLLRGWDVEIEMDAFDAVSLYGFSAADELLKRGEL